MKEPIERTLSQTISVKMMPIAGHTISEYDKQKWFDNAVNSGSRNRRPLSSTTISIAVSLICVVVLAGFGFLNQYFYQLFVRVDTDEIALAESFHEFIGSGRLQALISATEVGHINQTTWTSYEEELCVLVAKGMKLNRISYSKDDTQEAVTYLSPSHAKDRVVVYEDTGMTVQQFIEQGAFVAALEDDEFAFVNISITAAADTTEVVYYQTKAGNIKLSFSTAWFGMPLYPEEKVEELTIGGNTFVYVEKSEYHSEALYMVVEESGHALATIMISGGNGRSSLLKAANALKLYNVQALGSDKWGKTELRFSRIPEISQSHEVIHNAVQDAWVNGRSGVVWEHNGVTVFLPDQQGSFPVMSVSAQYSAQELIPQNYQQHLGELLRIQEFPITSVAIEEQYAGGNLTSIIFQFNDSEIVGRVERIQAVSYFGIPVDTCLDALIVSLDGLSSGDSIVADGEIWRFHNDKRTKNGFCMPYEDGFLYYELNIPK